MDILGGLNQEQRQAVTHTEGPVLILAGAGSGKTRTLTHRIAYLVEHQKVPGQRILAVTFTNKAAGEMRERVLKLLGHSTQDRAFMPYLGTFHAICVRLLRQEAKHLGYSSSFIIFDDQDSMSAIKQAMRQLQIDDKRFNPRLIQSLISSAKNELISPADYANLAADPAQTAAAKVYASYQRLLRAAQAFDFDDLLLETVKMLRDHEALREKWQQNFSHILIDEYQDTNQSQYQMAKILAAKHRNICVVGDDWQSIYSWRGADFKNILDFEKDYPDAKVIKLEQNYRSTKNILNAAQAVISQNQQRSDKKLWTDNHEGARVKVTLVANEAEEGELVVENIRQATASGQRRLRDFAVLYRTNAQSRSLEERFLRYGVPYKVVGGVRFYARKEIKDMLAYLRLVYQPNDRISFERVVNLPARGLGDRSLALLSQWQADHQLSLNQALEQAGQIDQLTPRAKTALGQFQSLMSSLRAGAVRLKVAELIDLIAKKTGYLDWLNDGSVLAADRIENVQELISVAREYDGADLGSFLEEVALVADVDSYDEASEAVTLMTLHSAKGLEFPVVFVVGLEEGVFPHSRSFFDPQQLEEERRLMYVGMTRAREELYLVHASARLLFGKTNFNPRARFIDEIEATGGLEAANSPTGSAARAAEDYPQLDAGDLVRHPQFGQGQVVSANELEVVVRFSRLGNKTFSLEYAPLEKL
jgi:DNA helicase II / ATP-dependent DNA helicase PcrA